MGHVEWEYSQWFSVLKTLKKIGKCHTMDFPYNFRNFTILSVLHVLDDWLPSSIFINSIIVVPHFDIRVSIEYVSHAVLGGRISPNSSHMWSQSTCAETCLGQSHAPNTLEYFKTLMPPMNGTCGIKILWMILNLEKIEKLGKCYTMDFPYDFRKFTIFSVLDVLNDWFPSCIFINSIIMVPHFDIRVSI